MTAGESSEKEKNINDEEDNNIGENKGGDIKKETKKNINEKINGGLLFKKKKDLLYHFF